MIFVGYKWHSTTPNFRFTWKTKFSISTLRVYPSLLKFITPIFLILGLFTEKLKSSISGEWPPLNHQFSDFHN